MANKELADLCGLMPDSVERGSLKGCASLSEEVLLFFHSLTKTVAPKH